MSISLKSDDPRVGVYREDGSIERHPAQSLDGRPLHRGKALTLKGAGKGYFVVLPPGYTGPAEIVVTSDNEDTAELVLPYVNADQEDNLED